MIKHRADSIQKLNDEQAAEAKKDKTIAEQADTIELLKGCIMELADEERLSQQAAEQYSVTKRQSLQGSRAL